MKMVKSLTRLRVFNMMFNTAAVLKIVNYS